MDPVIPSSDSTSSSRESGKTISISTSEEEEKIYIEYLHQDQIFMSLLKNLDEINKKYGLELDNDSLMLIYQYMNWNENKIGEDYFDNSEKILQHLGLNLEKVITQEEEKGACEICSNPQQIILSNYCTHKTCKQCLFDYFQMKIKNNETIISCFAQGCPVIYRYSFLEDLLKKMEQKNVLDRLRYFLAQSYCENRRGAIQCRNKACELFLITNDQYLEIIECKCGEFTCLKCGLEPHIPASCQQSSQWRESYQSSEEKLSEILINNLCVNCPYCNTKASLKEFCNFVNCPVPSCPGIQVNGVIHHSFCIKCGQKWLPSENGTHHGSPHMRCSKTPAAEHSDEFQFLNYLQSRYHDINKSELALQNFKNTELSKFTDYLAKQAHILEHESQFLYNALSILIEARRTLQWSLAVNLYLTDQTQLERFTFFQQMYDDVNYDLTILITDKLMDAKQKFETTQQNMDTKKRFIDEFENFKQKIIFQMENIKVHRENLIKYCDKL